MLPKLAGINTFRNNLVCSWCYSIKNVTKQRKISSKTTKQIRAIRITGYFRSEQAGLSDTRSGSVPGISKTSSCPGQQTALASWFSSTEEDFQAGDTRGPAADSPELTKLSVPPSYSPRVMFSPGEYRLAQTKPTSSSPSCSLNCNE